MKRIFVDTSAWAALADSNDDFHHLALEYQNKIARQVRLVTTNYILDELYTLLLLNIGYHKTIDFQQRLNFLAQKQILAVIWISEEKAQLAWEIFKRFNVDKQWSFTDCVSYVVMQQQNLTEAFTFDHHFSQMGFIRCP